MAFGIENGGKVRAGEAKEGQTTAMVESYTSQVPSGVFLAAAAAAIGASVIFKAAKRENDALYIGHWVAPLLILGLYNKMVKQHGSDASVDE